MGRSRTSLNPAENSTPKSRSRRTIFNFDSFRVDDSGSNDNNTSESDPDLFVFGKDVQDEILPKQNHTKPAKTVSNNILMSNNEFSSPIKNIGVCTPENKQHRLVNLNSPHCKPTKSKLMQDLNSPSAFLRIKALQAIKNPEQFVEESESDDEVATLIAQAPKPATNLREVLKGVIAYVEVCNDQDDNSEGVKDMMRRLGATVHDTFLKDVTHVIFKDGRVSTYKKAKERLIPLLSMLWIEACKIQMYKVSEDLYPATGLEEYETMALLQKRNKPIRRMGTTMDERLKKNRSKKIPNSVNPRLNVTFQDSSSNDVLENSFKIIEEDSPFRNSMGDLIETLQKVAGADLEFNDDTISKRSKGSDIFEQEPLAVRLMKKFMASRTTKTVPEQTASKTNKLTENNENLTNSETNNISDLLSKISVSESDDGPGTLQNITTDNSKPIKESTTSDSFCSLQLAFNPVTPVKKKRRTNFKPPVKNNSDNLQKNNSSENLSESSLNRNSTDSSIRLHISSTSEESKTTFCSSNESSFNRNEISSGIGKGTDELLKEINTAVSAVISNRRRSMRIAANESLTSNSQISNKSLISDSQISNKSRKSRKVGKKINDINFANLGDSTLDYLAEELFNNHENVTVDVNVTSNITSVSNVASNSKNSTCNGSDNTSKDSDIISNSMNISCNGNITSNTKNIERNGIDIKSIRPKITSDLSKSRRTISELPNGPNITSEISKIIACNGTDIKSITPKIVSDLSKSISARKSISGLSNGSKITSELSKLISSRRTLGGALDNITETSEEDLSKIDSVPYFDSPVNKNNSKETDPNTPKIIKKRKLFTMCAVNDTSIINSSITEENNQKDTTLDLYFQNSAAKIDARKVIHAKRVLKKNQKPTQATIKSFFFAETDSATSQILTDSLIQNLSAIAPARRSTLEFEKKPTKKELKEKAQLKIVEKRVTNIVCTSLHKNEIEIAKKAIRKLGGYILCETVCSSTSHVVSLEPRRTLSLLKGLARGCWIINFDWITKSEKAGKWLEEDLFEWTSFSPAVQRTRIERQAFGDSYKMDIFSTTGSIYISKKCTPPWRDLQELVTLCCGKIVLSYRMADIIVGEIYEKQLCVSPNWILDSITDYKVKSINSYIIGENV